MSNKTFTDAIELSDSFYKPKLLRGCNDVSHTYLLLCNEGNPESEKVPSSVINLLKHRIKDITHFNKQIKNFRKIEEMHRQKGRYEFDIRHDHAEQIKAALNGIEQFRAIAIKNNVDAAKVLAELDYEPLVDESDDARVWRLEKN